MWAAAICGVARRIDPFPLRSPPPPPTSASHLTLTPHPAPHHPRPRPPRATARHERARGSGEEQHRFPRATPRFPRADVGRIARKCGLSGGDSRARARRAARSCQPMGFRKRAQKNEKKEKEKEKRKRECAGAPGRCEAPWYHGMFVCGWAGERRLGDGASARASGAARADASGARAGERGCVRGWVGARRPGVGQQRRRWLGRAPRGLAAEERELYTTARASQFY